MTKSIHPVPEEDTLVKWQNVADLLATLLEVPAALIMRVAGDDIEVFVSSQTEGNPYKPGDKELFENSGLYCETVIENNSRLFVPDALKDPGWDSNPDIKLGMISYLGYPICYPDGAPFGTICVLDRKERTFDETKESLLLQFRELVQSQLALVVALASLHLQNTELADKLSEIQELRELVPICSHCKNVRDDKGFWTRAETYIELHTSARMSHGICPNCLEKHYAAFTSGG